MTGVQTCALPIYVYYALWYIYNYVAPSLPVAAINMSLGYSGWGTTGTCDTWSASANQQIVNYVNALLSIGIPTVIASGRRPGEIGRAAAGKPAGTYFPPLVPLRAQ